MGRRFTVRVHDEVCGMEIEFEEAADSILREWVKRLEARRVDAVAVTAEEIY